MDDMQPADAGPEQRAPTAADGHGRLGGQDGQSGDPRVAAALDRLAALDSLGVDDHVGVYDAVHRDLRDALADAPSRDSNDPR
jgi:hypothetical protein